MMRIINFVRQYLPAAFLIVIGLTAHGCGDSATVTPVVELRSLTVSPGTLKPGFSGGTTQYSVDLSTDITSVTVQALAAVSGDTVTINGQTTTSSTITLGDPVTTETTTPVTIVVSESNNNSRTYTILLKRAGLTGNNSLKNLTVSPGTLTPPFDANELFYTVDVDNTVGSVTVTPTLDDPAATMTVNGQPATSDQLQTITLDAAGKTTFIEIAVKAQNGNPKQYHVSVSRGISSNNFLKNLNISPGTLSPAFSAGTVGYTLNVPSVVPSNVTSLTVTPTLDDPTTASMTVNGEAATSGKARTTPLPAAGSNTSITIVVTAQNKTQKTYIVNVIRDALGENNKLKNLTVSLGAGTSNLISFSTSILNYTVNVASTATSVTVKPTLDDDTASMTVNGKAATSGQSLLITLGQPGSTTFINIIVTAQNGKNQNTYTVAANKAPSNDNNLSALSVRVGNAAQTLSPRFDRTIRTYTVDVASNVNKVTVSATKSDRNSTMAIDDETFLAGTETGKKDVKLEGQGSETPVSITVTPQIGQPKTYSLTIRRLSSNTNLSALSVSVGTPPVAQTLSPTFASGETSYSVNVATEITEVIVSASKDDPNAHMAIGSVTVPAGTTSGQATFPLNGAGGPPTPISVTVTAQNVVDAKPYTITVNRASSNSKLSNLTVSAGTLDPVFDDNSASYTVKGVETGVTSVTVTATKADLNAVMSALGSVIAAAGTATGQVTISPGTEVVITVIAQDQTSTTLYTIKMEPAPAAPPRNPVD